MHTLWRAAATFPTKSLIVHTLSRCELSDPVLHSQNFTINSLHGNSWSSDWFIPGNRQVNTPADSNSDGVDQEPGQEDSREPSPRATRSCTRDTTEPAKVSNKNENFLHRRNVADAAAADVVLQTLRATTTIIYTIWEYLKEGCQDVCIMYFYTYTIHMRSTDKGSRLILLQVQDNHTNYYYRGSHWLNLLGERTVDEEYSSGSKIDVRWLMLDDETGQEPNQPLNKPLFRGDS